MGGVNLAFLIISTDNGRATAACIVNGRGAVAINSRGAVRETWYSNVQEYSNNQK